MKTFEQISDEVGFKNQRNEIEWPGPNEAAGLAKQLTSEDEDDREEAFVRALDLLRFGKLDDGANGQTRRYLAQKFLVAKSEVFGDEITEEDIIEEERPNDA